MSGETYNLGKKENVVIAPAILTAGDCAVTVLPEFGGKIASIQIQGRELLQTPLAPIAPRTRTMSFDAADASGWDECLPSVAACSISFNGAIAEIPDHGDLWRIEWKKSREQEIGDREPKNFLALRAQCFSLPLTVERTISLTETAEGYRLSLRYTVTNTGTAAVPWSWAAHPLFLAEAGDRIVLPKSIQSLRVEGSGNNRLGKSGNTVSWPIAKLASGGETDLSTALAPDAGVGDKLFAGPLSSGNSINDNWCELIRPSAGIKIRVSFDTSATPYLGLWLCYGGWPDSKSQKQTCVALEPATAPVDSLSVNGPWTRLLGYGDSYQWPMTVDFHRI